MNKLSINQEKLYDSFEDDELELGSRIYDRFHNREYQEFDIRLSQKNLGCLSDHVVFGKVVLPFAFYLDFMCVGARKKLCAKNIDLRKVRVLSALNIENNTRILRAIYTKISDDTYNVEIISKVIHSTANWITHIQAELCMEIEIEAELPLFCNAFEEDMQDYDVGRLYEEFRLGNINYGPNFQVVRRVEKNGFLAKGLLGLNSDHKDRLLQHCIHPAVLDGGFQLLGSIKLKTAKENDCYIPVSLDSFSFLSNCENEIECFALLQKPKRSNRIIKADLIYLDSINSSVCVLVKGLTLYKSTERTFSTVETKLKEKAKNAHKIA